MSQQSVNPEALLLAEVSVPAFFQKLAADVGITPPDAATADSLISTGNLVTNTVDLYLQKEASLKTSGTVSAVKAATDAAFEEAGLFSTKQATEAPAAFLDVSGVRDAALLIVANGMKAAQEEQDRVKAAAEASAMINPSKTEEEDEENKKVVPVPKV